MGEATSVARSTRVLLDGDIGPLLVGLRTLEWRWDRLPAIGVDPDEMLGELADRAAGAARLARDLVDEIDLTDAADAAEVVDRTVSLHRHVVALATHAVPVWRRPVELSGAVAEATDLHQAVELLWRHLIDAASRRAG